jgi:hypothetical protein
MNWPAFSHEAMATTFQIFVAGRPMEYARQAAAAAFLELDRLENELSRFIETGSPPERASCWATTRCNVCSAQHKSPR